MIGPLSGYTLGTKLFVLGAIVMILLGLGFAGGLKWQAGEVDDAEDAQEKAEKDRDGWKGVAGKWEAAIKAQNTENAKARETAEKLRRKMENAIADANAAADKFLKRRAELNRQAEADKVRCDAERARICGAVLR